VKIIRFTQPGPPEVLELLEVPIPPLGDDDVLVRAHSIGVGMPDLHIRSGSYGWMPPLPAIPGTEMSGTIEAVGRGVTAFHPGQHVVVSARERPHRGGCYAEYNATAASSVFALPEGVEMEAAAALANYQVAYHLLRDCAQPAAGQSVLVYAAAGGVGSAIIDLARAQGLDVIAVCSGSRKLAFVKELGARIAIDRGQGDIAEAVRAATGGKGVDLILDPIGGPDFAKNLELLAPFGMIVNYGRLGGKADGDLMARLREAGNCAAVRVFSIHIFDHWPQKRRDGMVWLIDALAKGTIRPRIHGSLPLADARRAHEMLASGEILGKLLLKP
jgi:NADPH:quinone reductase